MDQQKWRKALSDLPLGGIVLLDQVDSTNSFAENMAREGAANLTLIAADHQTSGRGRRGRSWLSSPGQGLAFSLILTPQPDWKLEGPPGRFSGLGALAVARAVRKSYQLPALIKWPNDVLIQDKKICGVLVEAHWKGDSLTDIILGIGVNVHPGSIPDRTHLQFPATSLARELGSEVRRLPLLVDIVADLLELYQLIFNQEFINLWQDLLAYRGEWISLSEGGEEIDQGVLLGLSSWGGIRVKGGSAPERVYHGGEIRLRLVDRS